MNPDVVYAKTTKGLEEISQRTYRLPARVRTLLIMIDGRISMADLIGRASSPEEAAAHIAALLNDGFIEPKGVGPSQAAAPGVPPVAVDAVEQARRFMINSMVGALGPDSVLFTAKIEAARDMAALTELAPKYIDVIRVGGGTKKADGFRAGLVEFGVLQDKPQSASAPLPTAPTSPSTEPDEARRLVATKATIIRFLRATLGPDADRFTGKVEAATTMAELKQLAARHLELIRGVVGARKAEEFRQQVSDALNG